MLRERNKWVFMMTTLNTLLETSNNNTNSTSIIGLLLLKQIKACGASLLNELGLGCPKLFNEEITTDKKRVQNSPLSSSFNLQFNSSMKETFEFKQVASIVKVELQSVQACLLEFQNTLI